MLKIKTIKSARLILVTLTAVLLINITTVSAQEKPTLNRTLLLENKVELPSNNVNAKVIRVT
ncbi:MAG: Cupin 2 conserved barrel domain protein, partial [Methylococcaceae bacterium NSP1-1]